MGLMSIRHGKVLAARKCIRAEKIDKLPDDPKEMLTKDIDEEEEFENTFKRHNSALTLVHRLIHKTVKA